MPLTVTGLAIIALVTPDGSVRQVAGDVAFPTAWW